MYDYLLVGAGLFSSVFAYLAGKAGKKCLVVEKRDHIGGNCYTENVNGINVHKYGAHIFRTSSKDIWDFINQFAEFNNFVNSPVANYKGEIYNLPFNMNTFAKMWGISTPDEAKRIIREQASVITGEPANLEEHAISQVGTDIFEKLIRGYTEKQWGRSCKELPVFIMKRIPVRFTYDNNYFNDRYQGIPIGGYTPIIEKMLEKADVVLSTDYLADRAAFDSRAEKIIYTGMIDEFFDSKFGTLEYRSLRFETEVLNTDNYQGVAVMNYTDKETPFTRIIEHKRFEFGTQPSTVITREYPAQWRKGLEAYYPVNDDKNNQLYQLYKQEAAKQDKVIFGGRLGMYSYFDMQDTIRAAIELWKNTGEH